jgi:hypothetical protein
MAWVFIISAIILAVIMMKRCKRRRMLKRESQNLTNNNQPVQVIFYYNKVNSRGSAKDKSSLSRSKKIGSYFGPRKSKNDAITAKTTTTI